MTFQTITYDVNDGIATIRLDVPEKRNAFTFLMADELAEAISAAGGDPSVRVLLLTTTGTDFCVGMDLEGGLEGAGDVTDPDWEEPSHRVARPVYTLEKPVVVALRGAAVGVGLTMSLAADFRLASTDTRFGFPFSRRGLFPEGGSFWFLPRLVGLATARDWMISGRIFGAAEAHASGLVCSLHEPDELDDAATALATTLATKVAPHSVAAIRRGLIELASAPSPDAAFRAERAMTTYALTSRDTAEGIASFLEKRPPEFTALTDEHRATIDSWLELARMGEDVRPSQEPLRPQSANRRLP